MSDRYTGKDAERQMAWLAKALGKKVQYLYLDLKKDGEDIATMAEPGKYGEAGTWCLNHSSGHGYQVHEYSGEHGGVTLPLGHKSWSARDFWDVCAVARKVLAIERQVDWV